MITILRSGFFFLLATATWAAPAPRPQLQIINGSDQALSIYWLEPGGGKIPSGTVPAGKNQLVETTLGHEFLLTGESGRLERQVKVEVPFQAYRFPAVPVAVAEGEVVSIPAGLALPGFYTQYISAHGFPIVASAAVSPFALRETAWLANQMLDHRPDVRTAMIKSGARLCIIAHNEFTTDLPEFAHLRRPAEYEALSDKEYWDARARGTGGSLTDPYCTCAEENVLAYPGDPYQRECIFIHEFAHNIHLRGMVNVDPTFDRRLKETYDKAMHRGLWAGKYPSVNHHEYFAEGVQSWFDNNRTDDHDHNHVDTRAELLDYDPGLAAICREVFGATVLRYTKPGARLNGHLAGYEPAKAPTFAWPARLEHARQVIHEKTAERARQGASAGIPRPAVNAAGPPAQR